eukprot:scaffold2784_cov101-Isochrysis_galbana.AAC.4
MSGTLRLVHASCPRAAWLVAVAACVACGPLCGLPPVVLARRCNFILLSNSSDDEIKAFSKGPEADRLRLRHARP